MNQLGTKTKDLVVMGFSEDDFGCGELEIKEIGMTRV